MTGGRIWPRSLLGQMLLLVALALLVAQGLSATLLYRAQEQRRTEVLLNSAAFRLLSPPRDRAERRGRAGRGQGRRMRVERTVVTPLHPGEVRDIGREAALANILSRQGAIPGEIMVFNRELGNDPVARRRVERRGARRQARGADTRLLITAYRPTGADQWLVTREFEPPPSRTALRTIILQTMLLYLVLVGGLAVLLRRITRPLAALTARVEDFTATRRLGGQLAPQGPDDVRRLIVAQNAMEARIAALLDEKDVMLGAIGHDLKTPLAALRVRIEGVENDAERVKMAATIEDIAYSLDDILSLARVGRPSDPVEPIELGALVAQVVEEFEDMGEPVSLERTPRIVVHARSTWLRRALRNLISNAVRYGGDAAVSLARDGAEAIIRVADAGPGIPADRIDAMLEPFTRGDPSRNRGTGGAGLGLTLAKAIAEQHGGRLLLANRPDGPGLMAEMRVPTAG